MVYIKEAEKISDFLRVINAYQGVMYYENIRIYRDHKNMTNRLNNCEQANIDKIFLTAANQLKDIEKLKQQSAAQTTSINSLTQYLQYLMYMQPTYIPSDPTEKQPIIS